MQELMSKDQPQAISRVELDTQIATAKAYPRNVKGFIDEAITMATMDEETAESCIYSLPRESTDNQGNKTKTFIKGESVRLAEIAACAWGNLHYATRIIENDGKTITAEAAAWDLEKNIKAVKQIKRSITYRNGGTYSQDMQVVTGNAAASIALRNAILSVVPRAMVKRVYEAAVKFAIGDQQKLSVKVQAYLARFSKLGVPQDKILSYFGKKTAADITAEEVEEMIGVGTAIKDGNLSIDDAFEVKAMASSKTLDLDQKLKAKAVSGKTTLDDHKDFIKDMGAV